MCIFNKISNSFESNYDEILIGQHVVIPQSIFICCLIKRFLVFVLKIINKTIFQTYNDNDVNYKIQSKQNDIKCL